jgi:glycosyltransferase involved in cell wall biosynthesis
MIDTQIVSELGIGTLVTSISDFAFAIDQYASNPDLSYNQRLMCSKFADSYSWKSLAQRFESIYL